MAAKPIFIEKREQTQTISVAETALLCALLTAGFTFSAFSILGSGHGKLFLILAFAEAVTLICTAVSSLVSPQKNRGLLRAIIFVSIGPNRFINGMLALINRYLSVWNIRYEDSVRMLSAGNAGNWDVELVFLALLLVVIAVFWYLIRHRNFLWTELLAACMYLPQLILKTYSPLGAVFVLSAIFGFWLFSYQAGSIARRFIWLGSILCVFIFLLGISGNERSSSVIQMRNTVSARINAILYGKDTLPEGDLSEASGMEEGDDIRLSVTTEHVKQLYLRSYTGAEYTDGKWEPLKRAAYGGERYGFLKWLKQQNFDPNAQFAAYIQAGNTALPENEYVEVNHLTVTNRLANRKKFYSLYSSTAPKLSGVSQNRDNGYSVNRILGLRRYQLEEYSSNLPGELQRLNDWVYDPQNEVYRAFVHENYMDLDEAYAPLIDSLFHENDERDLVDQLGVYEVSKRIRSVLESNTHYTSKKALLEQETSENEDLLTAFLNGTHDGNSAYYATAAVMAFRSFQIPARYAEGYYVNSRSVESSGTSPVPIHSSDSHAWAEVYMDGMGWIPVDVTPGFYYDTYALLQMAQVPGEVQKTAALDDSGEEADNPDSLTSGKHPQSPVVDQFMLLGNILWGIFLILIFVCGVLFLILELRHLRKERQMLGLVDLPPEQRAALLFGHIRHGLLFYGLEGSPGWNCEMTEKRLQELFTGYHSGTYVRVNELMEKYYYGGEDLKEHELRLLFLFLQLIRENRSHLHMIDRIRMRYDL